MSKIHEVLPGHVIHTAGKLHRVTVDRDGNVALMTLAQEQALRDTGRLGFEVPTNRAGYQLTEKGLRATDHVAQRRAAGA
jgi:hypothetical protein